MEEMTDLIEKQQEKNKKKVAKLNSWQGRFRVNDNDIPLSNSIFNVELILENDDLLRRKIAFNEFIEEEVLSSDIQLNNSRISAGRIEDNLTNAIRSYIEQTYNFVPKNTDINGAISNVARRHGFNPLKVYLNRASDCWDGQERIKTVLAEYLGVEQSEYSHKSFLCLMISGIQKILNSKEKNDFVFDFTGDTGTGKTTFIQKLFLADQGYYTDSMNSFDKVDDIILMQRSWCVNDDELAVSKKTGIEYIKKFASQKEFEYRVPYGRKPIRRPKNFVFVRTTNMNSYLVDKTGNRRFVPNRVSHKRQIKHPATMDEDFILQLWGEAMHEYKTIDRVLLFQEVENLAKEIHGEFTKGDSIAEQIEMVLMVPVPSDFYSYSDYQRASYVQGYLSNDNTRMTLGTLPVDIMTLAPRDRVRVKDLTFEGFNKQLGQDTKLDNKIRVVMDNHPDWEKKSNPSLVFGKRKDRGYTRHVTL
ncbi:VapE domain-containing protein [Enterococcus thailandicus]|uniref:VapE domain-containing protein n=1 Tax=Enterococcus thailandicus TaxID=417368 RepID=UPI0035D89EC0